MIARGIRLIAAAMLTPVLMLLLSGCWDNHELDAMFIITGVALDEADDPEQMDITLQIGEARQESSGSDEGNSEQNSVILLKTTGDTMMSGLIEFNRDSSHKLLLHHNQVLLLGTALARQGVKKRIDLFMRDQQARMEVPVVVVEGRAEEALSAKLTQEKITGIFLARALNDLAAMSPKYRVRMLDFASRLLDETSSPVAPMIKVVQQGGKQDIKISGMAVFKGDRMVGGLTNDETMGYIWSMGNVQQCDMEAGSSLGKAVFHIIKLDCSREVTLRQNKGVRVALSVNATLNVGELSGFAGMAPDELLLYLVRLAEEEIRRRITDSFEAACGLNADIYGFGASVHRKYPKEWKTMKGRWDTIFSDIEFSVETRVRIPGTGQIIQSLEMEDDKYED